MNTSAPTLTEQHTHGNETMFEKSLTISALWRSKKKPSPPKRSALKSLFLAMTVVALPSITQAENLTIGDKAPDFTATTLTGDVVRLSDFVNNKPVYLKFWATWCSYCKVEMPHLQAIYDENGNDIEVLTVNVGMNDSIANIEAFYKKVGITLPTVFDKKGALTSSYGVVGTPYHVLINKQGKVAYQTFLATDKLDQTIALLSQDNPTTKQNTKSNANTGAAQ